MFTSRNISEQRKLTINKPNRRPVFAPATITVIPSGELPARSKLIGDVAVRYAYWSGKMFHVVFEEVITGHAGSNPVVCMNILCMNIDPTNGYKWSRCSCSDDYRQPIPRKQYNDFTVICNKIAGKISARIKYLRETARLSNIEIYYCVREECKM